MTSLSSTSFFSLLFSFFFFNDTATTEIYTLSLHDALPILALDGHFSQTYSQSPFGYVVSGFDHSAFDNLRSEEHTSELQSLRHLVCRLLLEKKKEKKHRTVIRRKECIEYCSECYNHLR